MWIEGPELGIGSLRGEREPIVEELLQSLVLVQPCCVLEASLEEGWKLLGASQGAVASSPAPLFPSRVG